MSKYRETLVLDFDGCIHKYSEGWKDGSIYDAPVEGAFEAIGELLHRHDKAVVVMSTRSPQQICDWMNERLIEDFPEQGWFCSVLPPNTKFWNGGDDNLEVVVTDRKIPATAYIDDRAIKFTGDWQDAVKKALGMTTWNEINPMTFKEWFELNNFKNQGYGQWERKVGKKGAENHEHIVLNMSEKDAQGRRLVEFFVFDSPNGHKDQFFFVRVNTPKQIDYILSLIAL